MRLEYKYIVALVSVFGLFMNLIDLTIVNVAIPVLSTELHASPSQVQWVLTGYLVALAVCIPISGWAGDKFGMKRLFIISLVLFTLGSALCAFAWNVESLIFFRLVQGAAGGLLTPVGTALVFRAFPPNERSKASALIVIPTTIAPASGPLLGGIILNHLSWEWIFLVNIPMGIAGIFAATLLLHEWKDDNPGKLDFPGFVLAASGLGTLLYGVSRIGGVGLSDTQGWAFGIIGLLILGIFIWFELRTKDPLIDVKLFQDRMFARANAAQFAGFLGFSGGLFLLPFFLQSVRGMTPLEAGFMTFPQAIGVATMAPVIARIYPRIGPRRLIMAGLTIASVTTLPFVFMDTDTNLWFLRGMMYIRGMGFGLLLVPVQAAVFATISISATGRASAVFNTTRQIAMSFGMAIAAAVLVSRLNTYNIEQVTPVHAIAATNSFNDAFLASFILIAFGILVASFIKDKDAAPTMEKT
jgi:EmrB/QacA subfamily drug resistance transporter